MSTGSPNGGVSPPGVTVQHVDSTGRAIAFVRAARAHESGDALDWQASRVVERASALGVSTRLLITAVRGGTGALEERDDLTLLLNQASSEWCDWIITNSYDRISRSAPVVLAFLSQAKERNVILVALDSGDSLRGERNSDNGQHFFLLSEACTRDVRKRMAERKRGGQARTAQLRETGPGIRLTKTRIERRLRTVRDVSGEFRLPRGRVAIEPTNPFPPNVLERPQLRLRAEKKWGEDQS